MSDNSEMQKLKNEFDLLNQHSGKLDIGEGTKKAWLLFSSASPEEFFDEMTSGLPEGTNLRLALNPDGTPLCIIYDYNSLNDPRDKNNQGFFFRTDFKDGCINNGTASVHPSLQKNGISRTISMHIIHLGLKTGMKKIGMWANYMGAYAWARIGFMPEQKDWNSLKDELGKRLDFIEQHPPQKEGLLPYTYIDALRKALASDDPKSYWFIVDQEHSCYGTSLGKLLTLPLKELPESFSRPGAEAGLRSELTWHGFLDLNDSDCARRFEACMKPDIKRSPAPRQKPAV